jgi:hypothetical protein
MTYKVSLLVALAGAAITSPTGKAAGKTRFTITDATGVTVQTQDVDGLQADFTGIGDGTFDASAQLLDTDGALLGDAVTTSFVDAVEVPPVEVTFTPLATLSATATQE